MFALQQLISVCIYANDPPYILPDSHTEAMCQRQEKHSLRVSAVVSLHECMEATQRNRQVNFCQWHFKLMRQMLLQHFLT